MKKQRGSALLAVMMLLIVLGLFVKATKQEQVRRDYALKGIAWSNALQQVCHAADTYATRNWSTVSATPATVLPMSVLAGIPPLTADTLV